MRCTYLLIVLGRTALTDYTATSFLFHTPEISIALEKDYEDQRRRQAQGVQKAKLEGKYKGRPVNVKLHHKGLLREEKSHSQIEELIGCSRHTISKVSKAIKAAHSMLS